MSAGMTGIIQQDQLAHASAPPTVAEIAQAKLISILTCPKTRGPVDVVPLELAGRAIRRGVVWSRALDAMVGQIEDFQFDFVRFKSMSASDLAKIEERIKSGGLPEYTESVPAWRSEPFTSDAIEYVGARVHFDNDDMIAVEHKDSAISFEAVGETEIVLYAHPWSGIVEISYLDNVDVVDLYEPHTDVPRPYRIDLGPVRQRVRITVTGEKNDASFGTQCLFGGYRVKTDQLVTLRHNRDAKVRGAPFNDSFYELLVGTPENGILLDIGGGNRQVDDARYVNLDYADYSEPDLIGDATMLPFSDCSVDAVYSSGVFEHIYDPAKAGAEVARVLKAGGKAVIAWAFMQPIHSEGQHFYNATPWGVEHAFAELKINRMWYDTSFAFLVEWGASVSGLRGRVSDEEIKSVCDKLKRWDTLIPDERKQYMANGVWCEFEKP